jgi:hypothetical protein
MLGKVATKRLTPGISDGVVGEPGKTRIEVANEDRRVSMLVVGGECCEKWRERRGRRVVCGENDCRSSTDADQAPRSYCCKMRIGGKVINNSECVTAAGADAGEQIGKFIGGG